MHIKYLKEYEYEKLEAVRTIPELKQAALPFVLLKQAEIMPSGIRLHGNERPDLNRLIPKLKKMYELRVKEYSEGIYSFAKWGINRRGEEKYYYRYIEKEIRSLLQSTEIPLKLKYCFEISKEMWERAIEKYRDKYFYKYEVLHGDLHEGNILYWQGKVYLIDWEYLRSGPKEMELSFFLCWHYLQKNMGNIYGFDVLEKEIKDMEQESLLDIEMSKRIKELLIPMWFLIDICYLAKGKLAFCEERIEKVMEIVPQYAEFIHIGG